MHDVVCEVFPMNLHRTIMMRDVLVERERESWGVGEGEGERDRDRDRDRETEDRKHRL